MALGSGMTLAFMVGQGLAWSQLLESGYGVTGNPANAFFYLTALHALHLLGGLVALAFALRKVWSAVNSPKLKTKPTQSTMRRLLAFLFGSLGDFIYLFIKYLKKK